MQWGMQKAEVRASYLISCCWRNMASFFLEARNPQALMAGSSSAWKASLRASLSLMVACWSSLTQFMSILYFIKVISSCIPSFTNNYLVLSKSGPSRCSMSNPIRKNIQSSQLSLIVYESIISEIIFTKYFILSSTVI